MKFSKVFYFATFLIRSSDAFSLAPAVQCRQSSFLTKASVMAKTGPGLNTSNRNFQLFMSDEAKADTKEKKEKTPPPPPPEIDISKLDIRVGIINKVWEHEEADKLYCEQIDIGEEEPRQIASGLKAYYTLEQMEGQRVLVLANLKTRKLVGFPSHGMVLCASNEDGKVEFIVPPEEAALGERITCEGFQGEPATGNQLDKKKMLNKLFPDMKTNAEGIPCFKDKPFMTSAGPCKAQNGLANADVA